MGLVLAAGGLAGGAPVVANWGFEEAPFPTSGGWDEGTGPVVGWTHSTSAHGSGLYGTSPSVGPNLTPVLKVPNIPDGTHAAYMWSAWGWETWFSQVVSGFEIGETYLLAYRANVRTDNWQAAATNLWVTLDSTVLVPVHQLSYNPTNWYTIMSPAFVATQTSYTLQFHVLTPGYGGDAGGMVLDAVMFMPEPASLALLALGGLVTLRRQRRR
jgi:hypothetical protein